MPDVRCERCGQVYGSHLPACPQCGANEPMELRNRPVDPVQCENCGARYDRANGDECPQCHARQPMELPR